MDRSGMKRKRVDGARAATKGALGTCDTTRPARFKHGLASLVVLCGGVISLLMSGCGDRLRDASAQERAAFQSAGVVGPSVDMERILQAKIPIGPYRVVPGDILQMEIPRVLDSQLLTTGVSGEGRAVYNCRVNDDGKVLLPIIEWVAVAGKSLGEIESAVVAQYYPKYAKVLLPVYVSVLQHRTCRVSVVGAVARPGIYSLRHDQMSLVALLMEAGGITEGGAVVIRLSHQDQADRSAVGFQTSNSRRREGGEIVGASPFVASLGTPVVSRSQLGGAAGGRAASMPANRGEDKTLVLPVKGLNIPFADQALEEGDSVVVEGPSEQYISVVGLVTRPGNMPCLPDSRHTLIQAIAFAGGLDLIAAPRYVSVYRLMSDGQVASVTLQLVNPKNEKQLAQSLAMALRPGDVVSVEHTPRTRANVVFDRFFRTSLGIGMYIDPQDILGGNGND